jgi:branched-chain amino acid transport system ATP-binding protein
MALLELDDVCRSFGSVVVADHLSYSVEPGDAIGIVGPNGAGKTSMLNLICGNLAPDQGRILYDGRDITTMPVHVRARAGISRTFQIPRPFTGMTVFENVLVGASHGTGQSADDRAAGALDRVGLLRFANTPAGALTLLDRKRLDLARALATTPRLLLLDEIAGGLTEPEVDVLTALIRELRTMGLAIIWIEHIVGALVSVVDRLLATNFGRLLAEGTPQAVLANPEVQSIYLGRGISG